MSKKMRFLMIANTCGTHGAQPEIGVWNAASSDASGCLAPGTLILVTLKNAPLLFAFDPSDVRVEFLVASADGPQHLSLINVVRSNWLEALLPYDAPLGPATLRLVFGGESSAPL